MKRKVSSVYTVFCAVAFLGFQLPDKVYADSLAYMSLGYQQSHWDMDSSLIKGSGWYLDGHYPLSGKLGIVGSYSRIGYDQFNLTDWQLGGRFQQSLWFGSEVGLEYRYVSLTAKKGATKADEFGHQGLLDLTTEFGASGQSSTQSALELTAAMTAYETDERPLFSVGYRSYFNRNFSLALHFQKEASDRRWLTLSVREEK